MLRDIHPFPRVKDWKMGIHCFQCIAETHLWEEAARNITVKMTGDTIRNPANKY